MTSDPVRLPRLLRTAVQSGAFLETGRLHPCELSVDLNLEPMSTADMILTEDDLPVQIHDLVEIYGQNGSLGIFRVANISTTYRQQRKIRLNHAIDLLNDAIIPGDEQITGSISQVLTQILAAQTARLGNTAYWTVGTVQDTATYTIDNKYDNAIDVLKKLAEDENDYFFTYDFSVFPWRLNFMAKDNTVLSEFRLPRNVENCQVTQDDKDMCNRLYLSVDTSVTDEYGSQTTTIQEIHDDTASQAIWGVVCKKRGISTNDVPNKTAWVQKFFSRYAQPGVQITVDGLELNRLTGETLDAMHMGSLCRVALPDYDTFFSERIVSMKYPDLLRQPQRVTVSLANRKLDASKSFSSLSKSTSANSSAINSHNKEIEKNKYSWKAIDKHVTDQGTILHEAGLEIDPHGVWLFAKEQGALGTMQANLRVQADAITAEVSRATAAEGEAYSRIRQTADAITAEVSRATASEGNLSTRITQTADSITSLAQKSGVAGLQEGETLFSRITQNAESITSEVGRATAAEETIGSRITQTEDSITAEVTRATAAEGSLGSRITQTADSITAEVTRATAAEGALSARITVNAEGITSKVSKGDISSTINQTAQGVQIAAGKIDLSGYTSLQTFNAAMSGYAQTFTTVDLYPTNTYTGLLSATNLYVGNQGSPTQATWQTKSVVTSVNHYDITVKNADGENVKVTKINSVNSTTIYYLGHS